MYEHPSRLTLQQIDAILEVHGGERPLPEVWLQQLEMDRRKGARDRLRRYRKSMEEYRASRRSYERRRRLEQRLRRLGYTYVVGTDEVGRGCLAGPVVAAAVVLPEHVDLREVNDSKQLSAEKRKMLARAIREQAVAWSVASVSPGIIDMINIHAASLLAMRLAVSHLRKADFLLTDGYFLPDVPLPQRRVIAGDARCLCIAAASILAKVYRDHLMDRYAQLYPEYSFHQNKGYATLEHRDALYRFGPCPIHRRSFRWQGTAEAAEGEAATAYG